MFIGRSRELTVLAREFGSGQPSLIVMYGRRRVGKSTLLRHALEGKRHVYYQATRVADLDAQELFKRQAARALGGDTVLPGLTGWEAILGYLHKAAQTTHPGLVVVLDEFPYLCDSNPALPSIVQKVWDEVRWAGTSFALVLCGSRLSFMSELLYEKNPLHGRHNAKLDVKPLSFRETAEFFPGWTAEECLKAYAVFGGMPYYLHFCNPSLTLGENIRQLVLDDGAVLRDEPEHILQAELQSVARYASVLRAVADGCTKNGEILTRVLAPGENGASLKPYLNKLESLGLLRNELSLDVHTRDRARSTRYYLDDFFLNFYYKMVLPYISVLEAGAAEQVYQEVIAPRLDEYMGYPFELICRSYMRLHGSEQLPSTVNEVGKIWLTDADIDVAGTLLDGSVFFGECKWSKKHLGLNVLDQLSAAAHATKYGAGVNNRYYLMFSRSGYSPEAQARAAADPAVRLVTLEGLLGLEE